MAKSEGAWNRKPEIYDSTIGWRFTNKALAEMYYPFSMGETDIHQITLAMGKSRNRAKIVSHVRPTAKGAATFTRDL